MSLTFACPDSGDGRRRVDRRANDLNRQLDPFNQFDPGPISR